MYYRSSEGYRNMRISHLPFKTLRYLWIYTSNSQCGPQSLGLERLHTINKQGFCDVKEVTPVYVVDSSLIAATVGY
jgi:hypothetical protein